MRTTIKQQMAVIKRVMKSRYSLIEAERREYYEAGLKFPSRLLEGGDKEWNTLNDAYSTLAAIALNESIILQKSVGKPYNKNDLALS